MKYIITSLLLGAALISGNAVAQSVPDQKGIMDKMDAGGYFGPYHKGEESKPLIVIQDERDFYQIEATDVEEINPDWIERLDVLKGKSAEDIFGESGNNGVVLIILKEDDVAARKYFKTLKKNKMKV